ncbi:ribonuclease P protein component [Pseudoclavibacter sp. CFCC 13796]|uniref:ribonuclease P protein component n=1 Tax=unclassified Pseudoclavibacter TaxID=2615177 RepID=UPI001300D1B9|nr:MULTISPECIES: ribonuclease P protein component [unclassified Pseudoclavibacter]KAB1660707.1 ribonuclease P protein component [Pseudoclavibacter sp. CFCC 13796]MCD7101173.1 ribonuclease P protein component [Pseudoclavibacter sp. 13-3]
MLDRPHRLRTSADFSRVSRRGRRRGTMHLLVHLLATDDDTTTRIGFVTSRAVGNAVHRNLVKRRLREIAHELLDTIPTGWLIVVRAKPNAARATYAELRREVRSAVLGRTESKRAS